MPEQLPITLEAILLQDESFRLYVAHELCAGLGNRECVNENLKPIIQQLCANKPYYDGWKSIMLAIARICEGIENSDAIGIQLQTYRRLPIEFQEKALITADKILKQYSDDPLLLSEAGQLYFAANDLKNAEDAFKRLIILTPHDCMPYGFLAKTYLKMNDISRGLNVLYSYKGGKYFVPDDSSKPNKNEFIDNAIDELEERRKRGYVFRPRKLPPKR